jgi:hypothetical protein
MAISVIPALIDALYEQATNALPDVLVKDGFGVTDDPGDVLMIGVDDPDSPSNASSASAEQAWPHTGIDLDRDETGYITCAATSWNGDGEAGQKAARDAVFAIADAVAALCRANPSLGVDGLLWTSYGTQADLQQGQDSNGAIALLTFRIDYQARLLTV